MKTTLIMLALVEVALLLLRRRRCADDEAIATLRKWREGR
jgi:hypothetical protein